MFISAGNTITQNKIKRISSMNITVINGSPKGKQSVTLQTILYLEKKYPQHKFEVIHAGQQIKSFEKDFSKAKILLESADAIIFSYPVYTYLAPAQLHRFIELMKENKVNVSGKHVTQLTTSKHFYDITAHRYIEENSLDMGMWYIKGISADMEDLLKEKGRIDAEKFFDFFLWSVENGVYKTVTPKTYDFSPVAPSPSEIGDEKKNRDIVIITDETDETSNLTAMINRFRNICDYKTRIVNISEFPLAGGCLGCFHCVVSEECVYKDNFDTFLRENIQTADAMIYAFRISDHSMGARFKMYDDRNFCNGHRAVTFGKPVGYLVSGRYSAEENLHALIEARSDTGGNFLAGVATDEHDTDLQIENLAKTLSFALETNHSAPRNFWGVGGTKLFRDMVYEMRGMMRADHKFYKKHKNYDFPQKSKIKATFFYFVGAALSRKKVVAKMGNKLNEGMVMPYELIIRNAEKK